MIFNQVKSLNFFPLIKQYKTLKYIDIEPPKQR